jgi:phosphate-selective porin OprO/OprP
MALPISWIPIDCCEEASLISMTLSSELGWSWYSEYARSWTNEPVFKDGTSTVAIFKGHGFNTQVGYVFENNIEPALRFSSLRADDDTLSKNNDQNQYTFALSKYINRHTIKVQTDISYDEVFNHLQNTYGSSWIYRLQVEIGI